MVMYHSFAAILVLYNHCSIFAVFRSDASHAVLMSWKAVLGRSSLPASWNFCFDTEGKFRLRLERFSWQYDRSRTND